MKRIVFIIFSLLQFIPSWSQKLEGYVFLDSNHNGIREQNERGISGVLVSNQKDFVKTDKNGHYEIERLKDKRIFIVKPADYKAHNYYLQNLDNADFPLYKSAIKNDFEMLAIGDPQMRCEESLDAFEEDIVQEMLGYNVDFAMILGDIADNDLSIYPRTKEMLSVLPYPIYPVFGNHDISYEAENTQQQAIGFLESWGPDYYSFNEGQVHFVVLNDILYEGWNQKENRRGNYFGGIGNEQYEWLKKDLSFVKNDKLIVLCLHIPLLEANAYPSEIKRIFSLIEPYPNVLLVSGHMHEVQNYFYAKDSFWSGKQKLQNLTVGAACGSWWCGPLDERGLPVSTCFDGAPNGYYKLSFKGTNYDYQLIPANHREDFQLRTTYYDDNRSLYVNVFSATPEAKVTCTVNGQTHLLTRVMEIDPLIKDTYDQRFNYDDWHGNLRPSTHLWKCILPNLENGTYAISIDVLDVDNKKYTGNKIIRIVK